MDTHRYRARWVFPVTAEPIEHGLVEVVGDRIAGVSDRDDPSATDLGDVALVPGLVNAHVHLEFSDLKAPLAPPRPFTSWIRALMAHRRERRVTVPHAVALGRAEAGRGGTAIVGEIATEGWSPEPFAKPGPRAVVFRELIGLAPERIDDAVRTAREYVSAPLGERCRPGLSPHAPYSVHPELYHELVQIAANADVPLAVHLAETRAELELLAEGTGELATMLRDFGVWRGDLFANPRSPLDFLEPLDSLSRALVVHGNHLGEAELQFLAERPRLCLVYCPRTHAYFGHEPHPWRKLLTAGGSVALGTDGRGSNPDLELWREMTFLAERFPDVSPRTILELGTRAGARALGVEDELGSLEVGNRASFALIHAGGFATADPYRTLFAAASRVGAAMHDGTWID